MPLNTKGKEKQNESVLKPCFINVIHNILEQAQQVTALMLSPCPGQGQLLTLSPVMMTADVTDPSLCLQVTPYISPGAVPPFWLPCTQNTHTAPAGEAPGLPAQ